MGQEISLACRQMDVLKRLNGSAHAACRKGWDSCLNESIESCLSPTQVVSLLGVFEGNDPEDLGVFLLLFRVSLVSM